MGAQQTTTMPLKIEEPICIAATGDVCGEGVLWERDTQSVYWTDINRFLVHRYALKDGALKTWFFAEPVTCVMETSRKDTLALSLGSGIALWKPGSDAPPDAVICSSRLALCPLQRCGRRSGRRVVGGLDAQQRAKRMATPRRRVAQTGFSTASTEPALRRNGAATWAFRILCCGARISPGSTSAIP